MISGSNFHKATTLNKERNKSEFDIQKLLKGDSDDEEIALDDER